MQMYKAGDPQEQKYINAAEPVQGATSLALNQFNQSAFEAYPLGDVLYSLDADPMVGVITKEIFRTSFPAIHELFTRPGTFEFYMEVFRSIWGEDVEVVFNIPSPGVLNINITATNTIEVFSLEREIISEQYIYNEIIDHDSDNIMFQDLTGIKTQGEVDALMNELSPAGVIVSAELELG